MKYKVCAMTSTGDEIEREVEAESDDDLRRKCRQDGWFVLHMEKIYPRREVGIEGSFYHTTEIGINKFINGMCTVLFSLIVMPILSPFWLIGKLSEKYDNHKNRFRKNAGESGTAE